MAVKSDIEIAQAAHLEPIQAIAAKLDIPADALIPYGNDKAKISAGFISSRTPKIPMPGAHRSNSSLIRR